MRKVLRMDGEPYTVIGVMPPSFGFFSDNTDFWNCSAGAIGDGRDGG
jgi:hypothetical protein